MIELYIAVIAYLKRQVTDDLSKTKGKINSKQTR